MEKRVDGEAYNMKSRKRVITVGSSHLEKSLLRLHPGARGEMTKG